MKAGQIRKMGNLKKNFVYQMSYQLLAILLPLISAPYVARVLGADNSGIFSYTNVIANYFVVFGMLGLEQYGSRCIAKVRDDYEKMCETFSELFWGHVAVSGLVITVYILYVSFFVESYRALFLIQFFYVASVLFDVNWFFFGIEKFKLTVIRNSVIKIVSFAAIFVFLKSQDDLWKYTFIMAFSTFVSQLALIPLLKKNVSFRRVSLSGVAKHIKPLLILFVAVIAANINRMIDKAMLGWFGEMKNLGCYDYADKIIRIPLSFIAAFGTIMLSKMSNLFAREDEEQATALLNSSACMVLMISIAMGFGLAAVSPEFVSCYLGAEYEETKVLLVILSLSIPLVGWNNFVRTQMLIPKEMDSVYTKAVTTGAVVNIIVNCFLIKMISARGAAIATVVSYMVISVIQTAGLAKKFEIKRYLKYVGFPVIAGGIMYLVVRVSANIAANDIISLCIELIAGILVYGLLMYAYLRVKHPEIIKAILSK